MSAPQGVNFDGTNDYLTRGADLTGNADSKQLTGAFWFKWASAPPSSGLIYGNFNPPLSIGIQIEVTENGEVSIRVTDSSQTPLLDVSTSIYSDTDWHHIVFSFDLVSTAKRHVYVDDVSDLATVSTYTDGTMDFTRQDHFVGELVLPSIGPLGVKFDGDLADLWLDFGTYVDLSVTANRRKFIGASAASSVDLGSDGSTPTGSAPLMFFSGATSTWHTNDGTGGGFTENGALTDAATNPPDYGTGAISTKPRQMPLMGVG